MSFLSLTPRQTVDAPDHIGHGFSERSSPSYTTRSLAEFIDNNTSGTQYDVICGHSLGAIVAVDLFKLKNPKPARLVLLEPPIQSPYSMPQMMDFVKDILKDVPVEEVIRQRYPPSHTAFDIAITRVAWMRAEWEVMRGIFTVGCFSSLYIVPSSVD